ncbi:dynein regulatory complex subunit 5 [Megalobrama amblycephala]|uniref:dynein regulatory complex subunit 5 n=1 Tax=Megalobrama amblycephala TaxID=75352 RepID=UPI00201453AE|nr:dynein regulatory complex subunit 5 [Megalobrama amblycephala]XP_048063754.1 dynein regulatory complex subunit 5 [Megalobrama amblycephala]XP_048063755.1 dynein regulatory complex subunit 5 [Megalobrama amblycephala]
MSQSQSSRRPRSMYPPVKPVNAAADGQKMRSIIAEDPDWSLALVPFLTTLCLQHIINHFEENPILDQLMPNYKAYVLQRLPVSLPLTVTANLISDEGYWKRCCEFRWRLCDVSTYDNSWKRMFFERHLESIIELFIPDATDTKTILDLVPLCQNYVKRLNVSQLLPPIKEPPRFDEDDGSDCASDMGSEGPSMDHFDFRILLEKLPNLEELNVVYGVKGCGMNFEWNLFEFTFRDCESLAKALNSCKTLQVFRIHHSKVDDEKCCMLVSQLLDHPSLQELDFSHNHISDRGARAIGKLLNRSQLKRLVICNNQIRGSGAQALAHALARNATLTSLNLRLNRIGDEGGQALAQALMKNKTLVNLHLGGNNMTEPTAVVLSQALVENWTLKSLNLSNNRLGVDGGKLLEEGMSHNSSLVECDIRLTHVGQDSEYCITQALRANQIQAKIKHNYDPNAKV